ncbi:hypothetical protein [Noviherbaspirillum pedocola]|uniref:Uncharacterized protein n=1 Tax=Noviherbaspirillum pedocola TaxID=2801341 RepID=A0A934SWX5_9BURK|nr:hypothetical protein [Noviherbaspirillum pedocola]MBK4737149.1 hypothetical protein [Noviherbaspirillum pedocola]
MRWNADGQWRGSAGRRVSMPSSGDRGVEPGGYAVRFWDREKWAKKKSLLRYRFRLSTAIRRRSFSMNKFNWEETEKSISELPFSKKIDLVDMILDSIKAEDVLLSPAVRSVLARRVESYA